jgi:hypothetical protein
MARSIEWLDNDGETVLTSKSRDWGAVAASASASRKRWVRNNGDVALGSGFTLQLVDALLNGGIGIFQFALDTTTVRPPYGGVAVLGGSSGVWGATGIRYYRVTRTNASGETQGCVEFSFNVTDTSKKVSLSWSLPAGPSGNGVKVYRSTTTGVYTTPALIATLGAAVTSFEDDGTTAGAGALPAANTTAGAAPDYGTAPSLGVSDLLLGAVAVGEARPFWYGYTIPSSAGDTEYLVNTHPVEL